MNFNSAPHWLAKSVGSAAFSPAVLVMLVGLTMWLAGRKADIFDPGQLLVVVASLLAVLAGCAALSWIRPQRAGLSPPHVMLTLGFGGMLTGLLFDVVQAGPERLQSLCTQASSMSFIDSMSLHFAFLPGMHAGMLAGGILAIPSLRLLRPDCGRYLCSLFAQNLLCSSWMLVGMTAGALWLSRWQISGGTSTLPGMLGGMFVGMTWGMVVSVALYRGFFALRNSRNRRNGRNGRNNQAG
jgi:hypothetical protein